MKAKAVPMSLIATHPTQSFAAEDYVGSMDRVKELLKIGNDRSKAILKWMVEKNIVTMEAVDQCVKELKDEYISYATKRVYSIEETYKSVKGE